MANAEVEGDLLRAGNWNEFIGQDAIKARLDVHINAALKSDRMLDHVLLTGPPGFGKTTVASIIATRLRDDFKALQMPVKPQVLAAFLRQWHGGVLLLDEIHRCSKAEQENLLSLLQEGYLQLSNGRRVLISVTIIGATTEPEHVTPALFDRFPIKPVFGEYSDDEMGQIVATMAEKLNVKLNADGCTALGRATGGTPRNARSLMLAARDLADVGRKVTVDAILDLTGVAPDGLTLNHVAYLQALKQLGGFAGMERLASMLRLHKSLILDLERLLLKREFIVYGDTGREMTEVGYRRINGDGPTRRRATT